MLRMRTNAITDSHICVVQKRRGAYLHVILVYIYSFINWMYHYTMSTRATRNQKTCTRLYTVYILISLKKKTEIQNESNVNKMCTIITIYTFMISHNCFYHYHSMKTDPKKKHGKKQTSSFGQQPHHIHQGIALH